MWEKLSKAVPIGAIWASLSGIETIGGLNLFFAKRATGIICDISSVEFSSGG